MGKIINFIRSLSSDKTNTSKNTLKKNDAYYKKLSNKTNWPEVIPLNSIEDNTPNFPREELPKPILDAAIETSRFVKVPVESPCVVSLSTIAVAIGKKAVISERKGLLHYVAMFFTVVSISGERKSAIFKIITYSLTKWMEDKVDLYKSEKLKTIIKNKLLSKQKHLILNELEDDGSNIEEITKKLLEHENKILPIPPTPSLFTTDCTEQRLFQKMHDRYGCYAVMAAEGRPVYNSIIGSDSKSNGDAIYLSGISGDLITRDRVGGEDGPEERQITNPCLNVCVMIQPDLYNRALTNHGLNSSGAIARIWPIKPRSFVGHRIEKKGESGLNSDRLNPFRNITTKILESRIEEDVDNPHVATLSNEADEARRLFSNKIESSMAKGGLYERNQDIACKAVSQTCKLALILHLTKYPDLIDEEGSVVDIDTWDSAEKIGEWFLNSAVSMKNHSENNKPIYNAYNTLKWISKSWKKPHIDNRELMQRGPSPRLSDASEATAVLEILANHNFLKKISSGEGKSSVYLINPICFSDIKSIIPEPT